MALVLIIKFVLSLFVGYLIFMFMSPILYEIRYNSPGLWANVSPSLLAIADQWYGAWLMMSVIIAAVLILWGFANANRKNVDDYAD